MSCFLRAAPHAGTRVASGRPRGDVRPPALLLGSIVVAACNHGAVDTGTPADDSSGWDSDRDDDGALDVDDCDDDDPSVFPGANELCDGIDQDCDGVADDGVTMTFFADADGDGFGVDPREACTRPSGYADVGGDCDDKSATTFPNALEVIANGVDEDCDGGELCYDDDDDDGYLDDTLDTRPSEDPDCDDAFEAPSSDPTTDCDDLNPWISPGWIEVCNNGIDDDCDGGSPECAFSGDIDLVLSDVVFPGVIEDGELGWSVAGAGDTDGDGHDDLIFGSNHAGAYVVRGPVTGPTFDLAFADATLVSEEWGIRVAGAGDIDADGNDDVLVGAPRYLEGDLEPGVAYLFDGPVSGTLTVADARAAFIGHEDGALAGTAIARAGDVDADGHGDVLVGAPDNGGSDYGAGAVYVVQGPVTGTMSLADADAVLMGEEVGDCAGASTAGGDFDADGTDDVVVGAFSHGTSNGAVYVVPGPATGAVSLADADKLLGDYGDHAGASLASVGDENGDGHDDLLIGAPEKNEGSAYLVLGPITSDMNLATSAHARLLGEEPDGETGTTVSGAGDLDLSGTDDLLVGAPENEHSEPKDGVVYLVLGPVTGNVLLYAYADAEWFGDTDLSLAGSGVASAGDVNADGHPDLVIGASGRDYGAGAAYLLYGLGL